MAGQTATCSNCGAHLPAKYGSVRCRYCGRETLVHRPVGAATAPSVSRSSGIIVAVAVLLLMAMVGAASWVFTLGSLGSSESIIVPGAVDTLLQSKICLLDDLNGDGAGEIGALVSPGNGDERAPAIVSGANGDIVWQGDTLGEGTDVHLLCVGSRWLAAVDNQQFELLLVNAHDPEKQTRRALSDSLEQYGTSETCLALSMADHSRLGFSLEDASEQDCDTPTERRPNSDDTTTCGIISMLEDGVAFESEGVSFQLSARRPGTPFLQVAARRDDETLWDVPLRLVPVGGEQIGCFVAATCPGVFMVFGAPRGERHGVSVLGLNPDSGTERYASRVEGTYGTIRGLYYNGRFAVLGLPRRMVALDPATGQVAWQLGH